MKVKRILANVKARNIGDAKRFYEKVLGLEQLMIWGGLPPTVPMPNQLSNELYERGRIRDGRS
jgi:hypothetical protein